MEVMSQVTSPALHEASRAANEGFESKKAEIDLPKEQSASTTPASSDSILGMMG